MDADDHPVETILAEGRRFMVPLYQRKYQWADERIVPFWTDVAAKAAEVLDGDNRFQHYMGALILAPIGESAQIGVTPRVQVVDGQQRLTTFQLLLAAIREVARDHKCEAIMAHVEDYLFNPLKSKDTDPLTKFKLTPTPSDRQVFHDILEQPYSKIRKNYAKFYWGNRIPKNTELRALRAFDEFRQHVRRFAAEGPVDVEAEEDASDPSTETTDSGAIVEQRLEALLNALLGRMKLVVITLGEGDDAQVIFETLNSKGEPLLAMDLVRNNIFYRAEKEGTSAEALYKKLWDPFDGPWWRAAAPNARPKRPRIDHFLAHVLAAQTGQKISMRELYAEYRAFAVTAGRPRFECVEDELNVLSGYAPIYETLEGRGEADPSIAWLGRKLAAWQVTTAYPIALQIGSDEVGSDARSGIAKLLYSYIVRRALSGLTTKNLNRIFQALSQQFAQNGPSINEFVKFFRERSGDSTRFPDDKELRQGIMSHPAYTNAPGPRIKDVLWELEKRARPKFAEKVESPPNLQTEHVLPVSWTDDWPFSDGETVERWSEDPRATRRNQALNTLGNLTLITAGLNASSGNRGFAEKKDKYAEHTSLFLNRWILEQDEWHEEMIRLRGERLASQAVSIWPKLPDPTS
ncbi:MAG: DUF262 domain-containing protein [Abyssibacter sp.]|nr:DUF262 domain-containing protein [Abyssibacter sp.]MCK5860514.1 DUF262 domain-containing protein [Abyssibacter sp.]